EKEWIGQNEEARFERKVLILGVGNTSRPALERLAGHRGDQLDLQRRERRFLFVAFGGGVGPALCGGKEILQLGPGGTFEVASQAGEWRAEELEKPQVERQVDPEVLLVVPGERAR